MNTAQGADDGVHVLELPDYADAVLEVADAIPPGMVLSYGDIAAVVGGGPRQVGQVMARYGSLTCWWRVIRADGTPPRCHEQRAAEHYRAEATPVKGAKVDMARARWPVPSRFGR